MDEHLVFYDGSCGLCDHAVQFLLKHDKHKQFLFAPLQGSTAQQTLQQLPPETKTADSLILVEHFRSKPTTHLRGKAVFRILWLLGGPWKFIGWKFFLPAWGYDWAYRWVARNRQRFFGSSLECPLPDPSVKDRFLP